MGAPDRIVRHLRLRADSEASVRRTARKLEDALRCASLPDAGARVLLVRRLDLGRIAAGASPQALSLLLEQRVAAAGASWVHGATPEAERADFVYFRDALEARSELALRLAKGAPCAAWYWPLAAPELVPGEGARASLRRVALAIASRPEAHAALPAWVARLAAADAGPALASAIGEAEAAELLRAAGAPLYTYAKELPHARAVLRRETRMAATAHADEQGASEIAVDEPEFPALPAWIRRLAHAGGYAPRLRPQSKGPRSVEVHAAAEMAETAQVGSKRTRNNPVSSRAERVRKRAGSGDSRRRPKRADAAAQALTVRSDRTGPAKPREPTPSTDPVGDTVATAYGGLLFLLPVLERLGFAAWCGAEGMGTVVAQQILTLVLQRLDAPPIDSAWQLTGPLRDEDPGPLARMWLASIRRWLRHAGRIGVATLVVRPANIMVTATHADVFFAPNDADMRVRRSGLDVDPGWLPWFGRVVAFHYISGPMLPASRPHEDFKVDDR